MMPTQPPSLRFGGDNNTRLRCVESALLPPHQFEPHHALELPGGLPPGARIDRALPGLAQVADEQRRRGRAVDVLAAALLDEDAVDRGLAGLGGEGLAGPARS